jgi:hypothetical protein
MRLEGLGHLKISNDIIGNRSRDLPACSIVPQPTTLPRDAKLSLYLFKHHGMKTYGGMEAQLHAFLTAALDADASSALRHGCFTPEERTNGTPLDMSPRGGLDGMEKRKISAASGTPPPPPFIGRLDVDGRLE